MSLHVFDFWAWTCAAEPFSVNPITSSRSPSSVTSYPGPSFGASIGSVTADPHAACTNTGHNTSAGTWMTVPLQVDTFNSWARGGTNYGLALTASQSVKLQWKQFDSRNAPNPPYLQVTYADNVPPQVDTAFPPDNYSANTLTPELMAAGHDPDAWPSGSVQYSFTVYDTDGHQLATSGTVGSPHWVVPSGVLNWAKSYFWTAQTYDGNAWSDPNANLYALNTPVPQPLITSELSQNAGEYGFDPSIGNYTTSTVDAQVATVGPALSVMRDYNSSDPRTGGGFGAGWSSLVDARSTERTDPSGAVSTVVVTYPDGSEVAFGRNADGSFAPPQGRFATFATVNGGGYKLTDKNGTAYTFARSLGSGAYGITAIADGAGRQETFSYSGGQLAAVTSAASGRALHFTWSTPPGAAWPHVATVSTDPATAGDSSTVATWTYSYSGDELTVVCLPTFTTTADSTGKTTIQFVTTKDNAQVNGIEITSNGANPPPPPPNGVQINSGGGAVAPFVADTDFTGGTTAATTNTVDTSGVTNPAPQAVYQTNRFGNLTYTIPGLTAAATYTVRLHFAETYWTTAGSRTFNVVINGQQVLTNFDILATAGAANKAVAEQFTTTADSTGKITIQFVITKDNAQVNGIEITS